MEHTQTPLLEVSDLSVSFRMYGSGLEQRPTGLRHFGHFAGQRHRIRRLAI